MRGEGVRVLVCRVRVCIMGVDKYLTVSNRQ